MGRCLGRIASLVELLRGRLDRGVMEALCRRDEGLFPAPKAMEFSCTCPDWASMCTPGRARHRIPDGGTMATVELTRDNFEHTIEKGGTLLIDWWAAWCGPCRRFAPIYEAASENYPDATFGKIDTDAQRELAAAFNIMSIPTLMIFRDKVLLFSEAGLLPAPALDELIEKVRALDMDEVRREIGAREAREGPTGG